jgi:hypothetical protein
MLWATSGRWEKKHGDVPDLGVQNSTHSIAWRLEDGGSLRSSNVAFFTNTIFLNDHS